MTRTHLTTYKKDKKRIFGLKQKTAWNVASGLIFIVIVATIGSKFKALEPMKLVSPLPLRAYAMEEFIIKPLEPSLADLPERQSNIEIISKIWGKDAYIGEAIATCESGLRSNAFNGSNSNGTTDAGLFQENSVHGWSKDQLFDPIINTGIAYSQFIQQGTTPWNSSKQCWGVKI